MNNLQSAIGKGLGFLAKDQEKNGSFLCLVSKKLDDYSRAKTVPAIVPTNIVLSSLINIGGDRSKKIKKKSADFLLKEKSEYWSFNYWFRKSHWYKKEPYPDDLDDTFCALAALYEYHPRLFSGDVMAKIVTMLTSAEKSEGGPYDMWLVPEEGRNVWNDTDLVVNANIAYFLSLQDIFLPKVIAFIKKSIDEEDYEFPYNKIYPAAYFISRFYKGEKTDQIVKLILSKQEPSGGWENPLRTALAISTLINLTGLKHRENLTKGIGYLLKTQGKNGGWRPFSFYFQMKTKKKTLYAGSASTTTALCLEAINKFLNEPKETKVKSAVINSRMNESKIYAKIVRRVRRRFAFSGPDLQNQAEKIIRKTLKNDKDRQIVLLPYLFKVALGKTAEGISDDMLVRFGAANLFGWIAYTIYDDFLDGEGDPETLSVANISLRESSSILDSILPEASGFMEFSRATFDAIDSANTWEVKNCRSRITLPKFGNYLQLAEKSFGHALGPIGILFALGYREKSPEVQNTIRFFKNYIIARQLNDDAHDWEDDLKRGYINAVGARLLRLSKSTEPKNLRKLFWEKTVPGVCEEIKRHTYAARYNLKKNKILKYPAIFEKLLRAIEASADKALKERKETIKFMSVYNKSIL
ncbi:MAG: hypothetical protein HYS87_03295 [Candidatus Colwellbacteria bacterium]|nr:hypothetical protein [Candidatus Colwellbacteria bacterium]